MIPLVAWILSVVGMSQLLVSYSTGSRANALVSLAFFSVACFVLLGHILWGHYRLGIPWACMAGYHDPEAIAETGNPERRLFVVRCRRCPHISMTARMRRGM